MEIDVNPINKWQNLTLDSLAQQWANSNQDKWLFVSFNLKNAILFKH
jgi:hypothetical protein